MAALVASLVSAGTWERWSALMSARVRHGIHRNSTQARAANTTGVNTALHGAGRGQTRKDWDKDYPPHVGQGSGLR